APGPLMNTVTLRRPCSIAFFTASSAASCAANGVDLREPLKPHVPDELHEITFPLTSVMDTIVLLKVAAMWAIPVWMFFLTFFFCLPFGWAVGFWLLVSVAMVPYFFAATAAPCFLIAMRRGPFRVRALVCVRW